MSTVVREQFRPVSMVADASYESGGRSIGGFLAKTSGTITIIDLNGDTIVDAIPVTAGVYTPIPFFIGEAPGFTVTLGGGASGTLGI